MNIDDIYEKIENGEMDIDTINGIDLSHIKNVDMTYIDLRTSYFDTMQMSLKISINSLN